MRESTAAQRYAEALFEVADKLGQTEEVSETNGLLQEVLDANPKLMKFLCTPHTATAGKKMVIKGAFSESVPKVVTNFLCLLLDKRRIEDLPGIIDEYERLRDERLGIQKASVISAIPLDEEGASALKHKLEELSGKTVAVQVEVQPDIIGGLIVVMDNTVIDGSIRGQLEDIAKLLRATRVH